MYSLPSEMVSTKVKVHTCWKQDWNVQSFLFVITTQHISMQLKTFLRKVPKSQIESFEKTAVKVFNLHLKHWIKQNVDMQNCPLDASSMLDFLRACWGRSREYVPLCNSVYPKVWLRHFLLEGLQLEMVICFTVQFTAIVRLVDLTIWKLSKAWYW